MSPLHCTGKHPFAGAYVRVLLVQLCHQMLDLANCGDKFRTDGGCGIVFGILRDSAYKIRGLAENELKAHGAAFEKPWPLNTTTGAIENPTNQTRER